MSGLRVFAKLIFLASALFVLFICILPLWDPAGTTWQQLLERAGQRPSNQLVAGPGEISIPVDFTLAQILPDLVPDGPGDADGSADVEPEVAGNLAAADDDPSSPNMDLPDNDNEHREGEVGDWREVSPGQGDQRLSEVIRSHWVRLNSAGQFTGRISTIDPQTRQLRPAADLLVRLMRGSDKLGEGMTNAEGRFVVEDLEPGTYSLVATGRSGFLAYSLNILPPNAQLRAAQRGTSTFQLVHYQAVEDELKIDATAVPPTFRTIRRYINSYYPEMQASDVGEQEYQPVLEADRQAQARGANEPEGAERRRGNQQLDASLPPSRDATTIRNYTVPLLPDGRMLGRLHSIAAETGRPKMIQNLNVFIVQDDREVRRTAVDKFGVFEVRGLQPGVYSLVAAGRDGFGAVGFQLVGQRPPAAAMRSAPQRRSPFSLLQALRPRRNDIYLAQLRLDDLDDLNLAPSQPDGLTPLDDPGTNNQNTDTELDPDAGTDTGAGILDLSPDSGNDLAAPLNPPNDTGDTSDPFGSDNEPLPTPAEPRDGDSREQPPGADGGSNINEGDAGLAGPNNAGPNNNVPFPISMAIIDDPRCLQAGLESWMPANNFFAGPAAPPIVPMAGSAPFVGGAPMAAPSGGFAPATSGFSSGGGGGGFGGGLLAAGITATAIAVGTSGGGNSIASPFSTGGAVDSGGSMTTGSSVDGPSDVGF
ncbi:MAG: hypothetical protein R3E01_30730 [Pirellulaceae bacterium]|nr:hypothetical protein [Planctomycetales bacterium]